MEAGICCMRFRPTCRWTSSEEEQRQRSLSPMAHSVQYSTGPSPYILGIGAAIGSLPGNHGREALQKCFASVIPAKGGIHFPLGNGPRLRGGDKLGQTF